RADGEVCLFGGGRRYNEMHQDPGAQTERRGVPRPVRLLLGGEDLPAALRVVVTSSVTSSGPRPCPRPGPASPRRRPTRSATGGARHRAAWSAPPGRGRQRSPCLVASAASAAPP